MHFVWYSDSLFGTSTRNCINKWMQICLALFRLEVYNCLIDLYRRVWFSSMNWALSKDHVKACYRITPTLMRHNNYFSYPWSLLELAFPKMTNAIMHNLEHGKQSMQWHFKLVTAVQSGWFGNLFPKYKLNYIRRWLKIHFYDFFSHTFFVYESL